MPSEVRSGALKTATGNPVSGQICFNSREVCDQFTPSAAAKRARVVSPNTASNNTNHQSASTHLRRRTVPSSGEINTTWMPHASTISSHSAFTTITPTASYGPRLLHTNPPTLDTTALTPPRLVTPTTQEPATPKSVAAALERVLLVADKPTTLHSPVPSSPSEALRSPITVKSRNSLSQSFLPGLKNAPTPYSSPCQPQSQCQSSPTLAAAAPMDAGVRMGQSMTHSIAPLTAPQRSSAAQFCLTTPSLAASPVAGLGSKMQPTQATGLRSDISEGLMCPMVTPHCAFAAAFTPAECDAAPCTRTPAQESDAMQINLEVVRTASMAGTRDVSPLKIVHRRRTVSVPASARQGQAETIIDRDTALNGTESVDGRKSLMQGMIRAADRSADPSKLQDITNISIDRPLKPVSVHLDKVKPNGPGRGVENRDNIAPKDVPKIPTADNEGVLHCLKVSAPRISNPAIEAPANAGPASPPSPGLTTDSIRVRNVLEAARSRRDLDRTSSGMKSAGSNPRSNSSIPMRRRNLHSPCLNPISDPSEWDAEDPLSIFKPQNLVFMPSGPAEGSCRVSRPDFWANDIVETGHEPEHSALEPSPSNGAPTNLLADSNSVTGTWQV